jgi:hypothetical protein
MRELAGNQRSKDWVEPDDPENKSPTTATLSVEHFA